MEVNSGLFDEITSLIHQILTEQHSNHSKQSMRDMQGRLNFACPYCGDSAIDKNKARGNLYFDTLQYHCYNCEKHTDIYRLFKDFSVSFKDPNTTLNVLDYIKANASFGKQAEVLEFELFEKLKRYAVPISKIQDKFKCYPISQNSTIYPYLKKRLIHIFSQSFLYSEQYDKLYILNLLPTGDVVSFQIRDMKGGPNKYMTFNLEKIINNCKLDSMHLTEEAEEVKNINKLSTLFGIGTIDFSKSFTLFEGPLDAKFLYNSLGLTTAGRNTIEFDELSTVRYLFDNDEVGKRIMLEKLKAGKHVFLWKKLIDDYNLYKYNIKDLNDLMMICYKNKINAHRHIEKYFSNESLDMIYV